MLTAGLQHSCHHLRPSVGPQIAQGRAYLAKSPASPLTLLRRPGRRPASKSVDLNGYHERRCARFQRSADKGGSHSSAHSSTSTPQLSTSSTSDTGWRWDESNDAVIAYTALLGLLALGAIPALQNVKYIDLPYFVGLASTTIYIGAHRGISRKKRQEITFKEGALAPVFASVVLVGAYALVKYFPNFSLATFQNLYFWVLGSISISGALQKPLRRIAGPLGQTSISLKIPEWLLEMDDKAYAEAAPGSEDLKMFQTSEINRAPVDIITVGGAITAATVDLMSNHQNFTLNNMIACLVATEILQLLGLKSFRTGAVMLAGLLLYDVFWVFGSKSVIGDNVMLTVATSDIISGPTRLLFPRLPGTTGEAANFPFSLLGLGDIAVPGLLACLALRFDASRAVNMRTRADAAAEALKGAFAKLDPAATGRQMAEAAADAAGAAVDRIADAESAQRGDSDQASTSGNVLEVSEGVMQQRTYFTPTMAAYVFGLMVAFGANAITKLGQPALLYLVPATFSAISLTAAFRGEIGRIWNYTDMSRSPDKDE